MAAFASSVFHGQERVLASVAGLCFGLGPLSCRGQAGPRVSHTCRRISFDFASRLQIQTFAARANATSRLIEYGQGLSSHLQAGLRNKFRNRHPLVKPSASMKFNSPDGLPG